MRKTQTLLLNGTIVALLFGAAGGAVAQSAEDETATFDTVSGTYAFNGRADEAREPLRVGQERATASTFGFSPVGARDPRLDDDVLFTVSQIYFDDGLTYLVRVGRLETDEGAWQQQPDWSIAVPPEQVLKPNVALDTVWVGEGGYAGLLLLADWTWTETAIEPDGLIVESDWPPVPEAQPVSE